MNIKTAFPSNYITHEDLQGQDVPVQIAGCRMEPVKQDNGPDKDKPVLYFVAHQRGLVLNVTNAMTIASLYGDETDAWRGNWITLYPTQCQFGNRMVDCIRVRPFPPTDDFGRPMLTSMHTPTPPELVSQQPFGQQQPQPFAHPTQQPRDAGPPHVQQPYLPQQPPPAGQQGLFEQQQPQQQPTLPNQVQF